VALCICICWHLRTVGRDVAHIPHVNRCGTIQLGLRAEKSSGGVMMDNAHQLTNRAPSTARCLMAYDFSNDLTVILRRCDLLIDLLRGNAEAAKHLGLIQQAAHHMTDRIADPCELARGRPTIT